MTKSSNWETLDLDDMDAIKEQLEQMEDKLNKSKEDTDDDYESKPSKTNRVSSSNETDEIDYETDEVEHEEEDADEDEASEAPVETKGEVKQSSNARELAAIREQEAEIIKLRNELREANIAKSENRKIAAESRKNDVDKTIAMTKANIRIARENGDLDKEEELRESLTKLTVEKMALEEVVKEAGSEFEKIKASKPEQYKRTEQAQESDVNPYADKFVKANSWIINSGEVVQNAVVAQAQHLINKGLDPNTPEFYSQMADRLDKMVSLYDLDVKVSRLDGTVKKPAPKKEAPTPPREKSPMNSVTTEMRRDGNKLLVKATKADREASERLGLPLKLYMKEKVKMEKETNGDFGQWSTVF